MTQNKANKAALYSAFIFPGVGLWWLKHYGRACIFIIPTIAALWYIASTLFNTIYPVYMKMLRDAQEGLIVVNATNFASTFSKLYKEMHHSLLTQQGHLNMAQAILIACWLCSIASSYFAGKKMDLENHVNNIRP